VAEALSRGHDVTSVLRDPDRHELPAATMIRAGDAGSVDDVVRLGAGQDIVIAATRPPAGNEGELVTSTEALLAGLARTGTRLLISGGAGGLTVPGGDKTVIEDPSFLSPAYRDLAQACIDQLKACRAEDGVD